MFSRLYSTARWLALLMSIAAAPAAFGQAIALVSQVKGSVSLSSAGRAQPLQLLGAGADLRLERGARATVICDGDRLVSLQGPSQWRATVAACAAGRPLGPGAFRRLMPRPGRIRDFHGTLLEEPPSRNDEAPGKVPVLLSPRSLPRRPLDIYEASPLIVWASVDRALEYELVLMRGGKELSERLAASAAHCEADPRSAPKPACSLPWPWAPLASSEEVQLTLRAHTADPSWRIRRTDISTLRSLDTVSRRKVADELARHSGVEPLATRRILEAAVYSEAKLYNEAATALAEAAEEAPGAVPSLRLADLYLGLGLGPVALRSYQLALDLLPGGSSPEKAAAQLGIGRVYLRQGKLFQAIQGLEKALVSFQREKLAAEAAAVENELARAKARANQG